MVQTDGRPMGESVVTWWACLDWRPCSSQTAGCADSTTARAATGDVNLTTVKGRTLLLVVAPTPKS